MGSIELNNGLSNRRIHVPELNGTIRLDLTTSDEPCLSVPEGIVVETESEPATPHVK